MKKTLLILLLLPVGAFSATCTSISRTNAAANSVLTSTIYNADLNTVYTNANAYDLGCGTAATLEADALDTTVATGFSVPLNAVHQGCLATRQSASSIRVDQCYLSVNNNWVATTSQTDVSFGCTGCSGETNSGVFYVYALTTSDGLTLNLSISTTVPDNDGFDATGNRVLAKFFNGGDGNIVSNRVANWIENKFDDREVFSAAIINQGTASIQSQSVAFISSVNRTATGIVAVSFVESFFTEVPAVVMGGRTEGADGDLTTWDFTSRTGVVVDNTDAFGGTKADSNFNIIVIRQGADVW